jgi:hypothetical protein
MPTYFVFRDVRKIKDPRLTNFLFHWEQCHSAGETILFHTRFEIISGAFAKFRKALLTSSCLSIRRLYFHPHGTTRLPLSGFL